ncbi:MAG: PilZ domain-containing protein [Phycisphaerales bacterium]
MSSSPPIIIRQSARYDVVMRAQLSVSPEHAGIVRFSGASGSRDGWIECDLIDISTGGVGLITRLFVPRRLVARVRIFTSEESTEPALECGIRVQRVIMTDRRPAYLLGTCFEGVTDSEMQALQTLLARLNND